jgi:hypothetical protein
MGGREREREKERKREREREREKERKREMLHLEVSQSNFGAQFLQAYTESFLYNSWQFSILKMDIILSISNPLGRISRKYKEHFIFPRFYVHKMFRV